MEGASQIGPWDNVFIMLGTSAAALAGLLFVAVSLQAQYIVRDPVLRVRASANTTMTVILIIDSAIILMPQNIVAVGAELLTIAFAYIVWAIYRLIKVTRTRRGVPPRALVSIAINLLGVIAGFTLILRIEFGMYIVAIQSSLTLSWVMFNAWSLLIDASADQKADATT